MTLAGQAPAGQEHSAAPFSLRRIGNTDHGNNDADIYEVVSAKGRVLIPSVRKRDAMLFRAAPDLLEALRSARHDLWLFVEAATSDDETIRGEVAIRAIDEAIARATGSEQ